MLVFKCKILEIFIGSGFALSKAAGWKSITLTKN